MTSVDIREGDCRTVLRTLPEQSAHCCVSSPPYFGLRDYGMPDQIGLERTPETFVAELVDVFREVRRVLRDDGTLWLNLGDSYARKPSKGGAGASAIGNGVKPKDLIGIPWRVAFALQKDGWYLRQDIIWHKPNVMPESVTDRCTKAHEYIFVLSKSERYYFDSEAIREQAVGQNHHDLTGGRHAPPGQTRHTGSRKNSNRVVDGKRNRRSVWTVATQPFKDAHFATFPPTLIEPCILAGCPVGGTVIDPFGGAGTTGLVAKENNRNALLIELNPDYAGIARRRIYGTQRFVLPWERTQRFVLPWERT